MCLADADFRDFATACWHTLLPEGDKTLLMSDIESLFGGSDQSLVSLCVRSAFDLYLQAAAFPSGSEVLVTAINIPQMMGLIRCHGLKLVPVDINPETLSPSVQDFESLVTSKTVAVLFAHLYGRWVDISPIVDIAKKHGLVVLEDCAQAFCGFDKQGHPDAVASFFSFGAIKTSTAFGGAVSVIRDAAILKKMRETQSNYPLLSRRSFLFRLLRYSFVALVVNSPTANYYGHRLADFLGFDHKAYFVSLLRGYPANFPGVLRYQPPAALLATLIRQLRKFDKKGIEKTKMRCQYVEERLPETVGTVGSKAEVKNYWLFPIIVVWCSL